MTIWRWLPLLACFTVTLSVTPKPLKPVESDESSQVLGSSVVTSVSVIMDHGNGTKTIFPDIPNQMAARPDLIGSPGNMLEPDRYEFYTFDETGDLVKRLMTLEEIQGLIAGGDSEGIVGEASAPTYYHESMAALPDEQTHLAANDFDSSNMQGVHKVVESVQNVLKSELANTQAKPPPPYTKPVMDIHSAPEWSILLPGLLDNSDESLPPADINHLSDLSSMASENNYYHTSTNPPSDTYDSNDGTHQKQRPTIIHYIPIENVPIKPSNKKPSKLPPSTLTIKSTTTKAPVEKYSYATEKYGSGSLANSKYSPSPLTEKYSPSPSTERYSPSPSTERYSPSPSTEKYSPSPFTEKYSPTPSTEKLSSLPSTEKYIYPPSSTFGKYNYAGSTSSEKPSSTYVTDEKLSYSSPSNLFNEKLGYSSPSNSLNDKQSYSSSGNYLNEKESHPTSSSSFYDNLSHSNPSNIFNDRFAYLGSTTDKHNNQIGHSSTEKMHFLTPSTEKYYYTGSSTEKKYFSNFPSSTTEKMYFPKHTTMKLNRPTPTTEKKVITSPVTEENKYSSMQTEKNQYPSLSTEKNYITISSSEKNYLTHSAPNRIGGYTPTPEKYTPQNFSTEKNSNLVSHFDKDKNNNFERINNPTIIIDKSSYTTVHTTDKSTYTNPSTTKQELSSLSSSKTEPLSSTEKFSSTLFSSRPSPSTNKYHVPLKTEYILNSEKAQAAHDAPSSFSYSTGSMTPVTHTTNSSPYKTQSISINEEMAASLSDVVSQITDQSSSVSGQMSTILVPTTSKTSPQTYSSAIKLPEKYSTKQASYSPTTATASYYTFSTTTSPPIFTKTTTYNKLTTFNNLTKIKPMLSTTLKGSSQSVSTQAQGSLNRGTTTYMITADPPKRQTVALNKLGQSSNENRHSSTPNKIVSYNYSADFRNNPTTIGAIISSTSSTVTSTNVPQKPPYDEPKTTSAIAATTTAPTTTIATTTTAATTFAPKLTSAISSETFAQKTTVPLKRPSPLLTKIAVTTSAPSTVQKQQLKVTPTSPSVTSPTSTSSPPISVSTHEFKTKTGASNTTQKITETTSFTKLPALSKISEKPILRPTVLNKTSEPEPVRDSASHLSIKSTQKPTTQYQRPVTTTTTTTSAPTTVTTTTTTSTTVKPLLDTAPPSRFSPQYTYKYPVKKPTGGSLHGPYYYPTTPLQLKHAASQLGVAHNNSVKTNLTSPPPLERISFPTSIYRQGAGSSPAYTSTTMFRNSTNRAPEQSISNHFNTENTTLSYQNPPSTYSIRPSLQNYTSSTLMSSQRYGTKSTTTTEAPHTSESTTGSTVISNGHQNYITKVSQTPTTLTSQQTPPMVSQNYQKVVVQSHTPTSTPSYKNGGLLKSSLYTTPRSRPNQVKITSSTPLSSTKYTASQIMPNEPAKAQSQPRVPSTTTRFEEYIPVQTQQHTTSFRYSSTSAAPSMSSNSKVMSDQSTEKSNSNTQLFTGTFNSVDDAIKTFSTLNLQSEFGSGETSSSAAYTSPTKTTEKVPSTPVTETTTLLKIGSTVSDAALTERYENKSTSNSPIDDHIQDGISAVTNILLQSKGPDSHLTNSTTLNQDFVQALEEGAILIPNAVLGEMKHSGSIESQIVSNITDDIDYEKSTENLVGITESSSYTTITDSSTAMGLKKDYDSKETSMFDNVSIENAKSPDSKAESVAKSSDDNNLDAEILTTTVDYSEAVTETTKKDYSAQTTIMPEVEELNAEITTTISPNFDDNFNKFRTENIEKDDSETTVKEAEVTTTSTTTVTTSAPVAPSTKPAEVSTTTTTSYSGVPLKEQSLVDIISEKTASRPILSKPTFSAVAGSIPKIPGPGAYRPITPPTAVELHPAPHESMGLEASIAFLGDDVRRFSDLCNELSFRMWTSITGKGMISSRSLVLSPFAVTSMLAMVFLGARGSTSGQMNDVLRLDDMVTFNPHQVLQNITESTINSRNVGSSTAAFVRELYSDKGKGKILEFYKERAQQYYDGHVEEVNFSTIGDVLRRRTNLLIKRQTLGRIPEYLRGSSLNLKPPMAAFAANIFQTDCDLASTDGRDGEMYFVVRPSTRQRRLVPVPAAVWRSGFLAGYEPGLDATAVSIGSDSVVSTIFVLPGQQGQVAPGDGLARLEQRLIETSYRRGGWSRLLRSLLLRPGLEIQLPRFSHRSVLNVTSALQRMGLKDIFDAERADLRGLNGYTNDLYLSDMVQVNTFSTCGEDSAGARHHVETYPSSPQRVGREDPEVYPIPDDLDPNIYSHLPLNLRPRQARLPDNPRLRFDRPFLYFVRHNPTGMILHVGRFNPRLLP